MLKERQRIRVVNLIKSYITNGEVDTSRKIGKSVSDDIQIESFKKTLEQFVIILKRSRFSLILSAPIRELLPIFSFIVLKNLTRQSTK